MAKETLDTDNRDALVRVTERVIGDPDHRGYRRLVAAAGSTCTLGDALRRGIPTTCLERVDAEAHTEAHNSATEPTRAQPPTRPAVRGGA